MQNNELEAAKKHLSANDAVMARIIKKFELVNLVKRERYFADLVESIIGQQLSIKAASTIIGRFINLTGEPDPEVIIRTEAEDLRSCGISGAKIRYIKHLAESVLSGNLVFDKFDKMSNDEIIKELTRVKGIGLWTAHMFLIFTMGRNDILAFGDQGIRRAVKINYGTEDYPDEKYLRELADTNGWSPYESIVCRYLWKTLD